MRETSDQQAAHGGVDHRFGNVEAPPVVADEAAISGQPAEAALDHPGPRQHRLDRQPFLVGQVARIAFGLLLNGRHAAACRSGPHPELESRVAIPLKIFPNSL